MLRWQVSPDFCRVFQKYLFSFICKCKPGGHVLVSYQFKNQKIGNLQQKFSDCDTFILYKEKFKKYKGKFVMTVFCVFRSFYALISCLMALVCIPEVLMLFLTPILPYIYLTYVGWHMRQIWHFGIFDMSDAFGIRHI